MFSYRHAFHAGNHADVLKHTVLVSILSHMTDKAAGLVVVDTHAGAGLYPMEIGSSTKESEVSEGLHSLRTRLQSSGETVTEALQNYLKVVGVFRGQGGSAIYPGSPFIIQHLLREQDKLKLFELHPSDIRALDGHVAQLRAGRQVAVLREDGFEGLKKFIPPTTRRGLVLMDPSYEIKSDYMRVTESISDALKRFSTGTYLIWYPIIPRPQAHSLPKNLIRLAQQVRKPWLHTTLRIKSGAVQTNTADFDPDKRPKQGGLSASGMLVINPPYTLKEALQQSLPQMVQWMGQDKQSGFTLEAGA